MAGYFITATGTEMGKTALTAALCHQLANRGEKVRAVKPIMTGVDGSSWKRSDAAVLLEAMGQDITVENLRGVCQWQFTDPVSPQLAAQKMGIELELDAVVEFCEKSLLADGTTLIEGAGGLMTPITPRHTMLDLARRVGAPVVLVSGSYVGALSHTLSALFALITQQVFVQAVVVNETPGSPVSVEETRAAISAWAGANMPVFTLPRLSSKNHVWQQFPPILEILDA